MGTSSRSTTSSRLKRQQWTFGNSKYQGKIFEEEINEKQTYNFDNFQQEHNGEYICEAVGYASSTKGSQVSVFLTVEKCKFLL